MDATQDKMGIFNNYSANWYNKNKNPDPKTRGMGKLAKKGQQVRRQTDIKIFSNSFYVNLNQSV